jgi:predicted nucleotidyltransferase
MEPDSDSSRARFLEETRRIVARVLGDARATVYLFGSFATGKQHRGSDIDVAIEPAAALPRDLLGRLQEELEESCVPYRVDIVNLAETDREFRDEVKRTGRVWIERADA